MSSIIRFVAGMKVEIPVERGALFCGRPVVVIYSATLKAPQGIRLVEDQGRPYLQRVSHGQADFFYVTRAILKDLKETAIYPMEHYRDRRSDHPHKKR